MQCVGIILCDDTSILTSLFHSSEQIEATSRYSSKIGSNHYYLMAEITGVPTRLICTFFDKSVLTVVKISIDTCSSIRLNPILSTVKQKSGHLLTKYRMNADTQERSINSFQIQFTSLR
jgi:hypothetical protein